MMGIILRMNLSVFHQLLHIRESSYLRRYMVSILTASLNNQLKK
jgi:hypothetical protein